MNQIIIKDGSPFSADNILLMGDARQMMGKDVLKNVADIVERYQYKKHKYYILVTSRIDIMNPKQIRTKIVLHSHRPPELLGSICFFVDNKKGKIDRLWVLPLDRPNIIVPISDEFCIETARKAKGLPLIFHNS